MIATKLCLLLLVAFVSGQDVPGYLVSRSSTSKGSRSVSPLTKPTCDKTKVDLYTECSTCNEVLMCWGTAVEEYAECLGTTPYCSKGSCSADPDYTGVCKSTPITCSGTGFYPDPNLCQVYHYCPAANADSDVYQCPKGYVFNPDTDMCKLKSKDADCMTVTCAGKMMVPYGTSTKYYALCTAARVMFRCPTGAKYDGNLSCIYQCSKEGHYVDDTAPTKFFQCYYPTGKTVLAAVHALCSNKKVYSEAFGFCVRPTTV